MPYPRIPPSGAINHGRLRGRQSLEEELQARRFLRDRPRGCKSKATKTPEAPL